LDVVGGGDLRDWKRSGGLRVTVVAAGGPAVRAGLATGDVLLNVRGRRLRTFLDWEAVLLDTGPGDTLVVAYRREGRAQTARLGVTDLPSTLAEKVSILGDLQAVTLTPLIRQERNIQTERGALIYNMGVAAQRSTGLQVGDVIFQINRQGVGSAEDLKRAFTAAADAGPVTVWFERGGVVGRTTFYVQ
jgi:S1-C subfamily serine protease